MKGVLLALALPGAKAMGYATDGPEGIIYTSGNAPISDPVKYCSDAQRTSRSLGSLAHAPVFNPQATEATRWCRVLKKSSPTQEYGRSIR